MAATGPVGHGREAGLVAQHRFWSCYTVKREEQLGRPCPGLLRCGCSSSGWQVVVGDSSVAGVVAGLVEWQLVWVRKKRQKPLSVTPFFFSSMIHGLVQGRGFVSDMNF